jgi:hypothetical protein
MSLAVKDSQVEGQEDEDAGDEGEPMPGSDLDEGQHV